MMMHGPQVKFGYDFEGMRRVARLLLEHVRPQNRTEAYALIYGEMGAYMLDRSALAAEVDGYLAEHSGLAN